MGHHFLDTQYMKNGRIKQLWYLLSKKEWPILYSNLQKKIGHNILDI